VLGRLGPDSATQRGGGILERNLGFFQQPGPPEKATSNTIMAFQMVETPSLLNLTAEAAFVA
jgi:hypothetical protein